MVTVQNKPGKNRKFVPLRREKSGCLIPLFEALAHLTDFRHFFDNS